MENNEHPLRRMRGRCDLSIDSLAQRAGLSARTVMRAEKGLSIYPSSRSLICGFFTELLGRVVTSEELGLLVDDTEMETDDMDKLRRTLLKRALTIPGALALSAIDIDRLLAALAKPSNMSGTDLEHIARINEHCWQITNTSELASIDEILPTYLPHLAATARQTFKYQREAAVFVAQGYLLAGLVALDRLDFPGMERYSALAVEYSKLAGDYNLQAAALKQQATMFLIAKEPYRALLTYQQMLPFISKISPLLRSRTYSGLADASARCGLDAEAMRYVGLAYESFPADFEKDPSFLYADSGLSVLHMYDGLTYLAIDQPGKAMEAFEKVDGRQPKIPIGETTALEFLNLQGKAAVGMRNQELTRQLIEAAVLRADSLNCRWGRTEAFEVYSQARLIWPSDAQVRGLAQLFQR